MRSATLSLMIIGLVAAATPALAGGGSCRGPVTDQAGTTVEVSQSCFTPTVVRVETGDTVTWVNNDPFEHNVASTFIAGSGYNFGNKETFSATFREAGEFPYACSIHPGMVGTVVVGVVDDDGAALPKAATPTTTSASTTTSTAPSGGDAQLLAAPGVGPAAADAVERAGAGPQWPAAAMGALAGGLLGGLVAGKRRSSDSS